MKIRATTWGLAEAVILLIGLQVNPANAAEPVVVAPRPAYGEVARVLEQWIAGEMEAKGLPALSIALVDDQEIVWARGFGFADRARTGPGGRRDGLSGRLGLEAVHRPGPDAACRAGAGRPRRAGEPRLARVRAAESVRHADHAPAVDGPSLGAGARAAARPLLRPHPACARRRGAQPARHDAGGPARDAHEVFQRRRHGRRRRGRAGAGRALRRRARADPDRSTGAGPDADELRPRPRAAAWRRPRE